MKGQIIGYLLTAGIVMLGAECVPYATAQTERVLYSFGNSPIGYEPLGGVVADKKGNLFGTTSRGGLEGCGGIFELKRTTAGYRESGVWAFAGGGVSGGCQSSSSLIFDAAGNLYGTTSQGGAYGGGTAFELSPDGSGGWTAKTIWQFGAVHDGALDGYNPVAGLNVDAAGNLYGTTQSGGGSLTKCNVGTVFELSPSTDGSWSESILHSFGCPIGDGSTPTASVIFDGAGNIYGTTSEGGYSVCNCGVVFELEKASGWTLKHLFSFTGTGGSTAPLIFDKAGHIFGTASGLYPVNDGGAIFELSPEANGRWREKTIYAFTVACPNGCNPNSGLAIRGGHLYGVLPGLGGGGVAFDLTYTSVGWTETGLHTFGAGSDGGDPTGGVILANGGKLFGTTAEGGDAGVGTVYEIVP